MVAERTADKPTLLRTYKLFDWLNLADFDGMICIHTGAHVDKHIVIHASLPKLQVLQQGTTLSGSYPNAFFFRSMPPSGFGGTVVQS